VGRDCCYGFTFSGSAAEVLPLKFESPLYTAEIECVPSASDAVANVALLPLSVEVPNTLAPSLKVTVPVGVPAPEATASKVAVNATVAPEVEGFKEDAIVVFVLA
jgi:hypothetical protein